MSSYSQQMSPSPSEEAGGDRYLYRPAPAYIGHPTAERTEHRKRATLISSGGVHIAHHHHCYVRGRETFHRSIPFPDRGPSSLELVRSSKAVRLLLWGHPSATTTDWRSSS